MCYQNCIHENYHGDCQRCSYEKGWICPGDREECTECHEIFDEADMEGGLCPDCVAEMESPKSTKAGFASAKCRECGWEGELRDCLKVRRELVKKIKKAMEPIEENELNPAREYMEVYLSSNNTCNSIQFNLKPEQIEIVKVLVLSMANQNLAEMTAEFEAL